jgi:hypothetical protein
MLRRKMEQTVELAAACGDKHQQIVYSNDTAARVESRSPSDLT